MPRAKKNAADVSSQVYRFKITLLDVQPPIWRRIEVPDGTLDELHEHIQSAMGWTNSHLHQFEVGDSHYGDPELFDMGWDEDDLLDSREIRLGKFLQKRRTSFRFYYEYDFGDGWQHEIVYEGRHSAEPGAKYPRCVEGARACPPEDCGGPWGYANFLEAIRDPKHEDHDDLLEWIGGKFDSEAFDPRKISRYMRRGLPNWRDDR
jgi:hypothetical protein